MQDCVAVLLAISRHGMQSNAPHTKNKLVRPTCLAFGMSDSYCNAKQPGAYQQPTVRGVPLCSGTGQMHYAPEQQRKQRRFRRNLMSRQTES